MTLEEIKKEIASIKRVQMRGCLNSDYGTGYVCALSVVEGMLADLEPLYVVRCKDCKYYLNDTDYCREHNKGYCEFDNTVKSKNHYCGYAEQKEQEVKC